MERYQAIRYWCLGKYKSPLNKEFYEAVEKQFPHFNMSGFNKPADSAELINNGKTVFLNLTYDEPPTIQGGPLEKMSMYKFAQVNFQWGNMQEATAELHLVFYNVQYISLSEASRYKDGIVVMAFLYMVNNFENHYYNDLIALMPQVEEPKMRVSFVRPPKLNDLITVNPNAYITYYGTLITQPCSQDVRWMDFEESINISRSQYIQIGNYIKPQKIVQNPEQENDIYKHVAIALSQKDQGQGSAGRTKANDYPFVIETWLTLLIFGIFT